MELVVKKKCANVVYIYIMTSVSAATERIEREAGYLHPSPSPARAKSATTRVVDDMIRVFDANTSSTDDEKVNVLIRFGKFAKSAGYRTALASAMAVKESAIVTSLVVGVVYGSKHAVTGAVGVRAAYEKGLRVTPFAMAVWTLLTTYVAFHSFVSLVKKTKRGVSKIIFNGAVPWS
jgi:hypothetical protein